MSRPLLLAVPNVTEGRNEATVKAIGRAFAGAGEPGAALDAPGGVRVLDVHSDADHDRSVFTLAGRQGQLSDALLRGAATAVERIDVVSAQTGGRTARGQHPHVGALDVVPVVYLRTQERGAACAEALVVADRIGTELAVPVFLYGELAGGRPGTTRAELRRGGVSGLAGRMAGEDDEPLRQRPDFGPLRLHPTAGAVLVAARPPLVAFNVQLKASAALADARAIAALVREGGQEGLPGVRAIAVQLHGGVAQVSMNIERPLELPLAAVVEAIGRHAPIANAELVGLAPEAALEGLPEALELTGFDPDRHVLEKALGSL